MFDILSTFPFKSSVSLLNERQEEEKTLNSVNNVAFVKIKTFVEH